MGFNSGFKGLITPGGNSGSHRIRNIIFRQAGVTDLLSNLQQKQLRRFGDIKRTHRRRKLRRALQVDVKVKEIMGKNKKQDVQPCTGSHQEENMQLIRNQQGCKLRPR